MFQDRTFNIDDKLLNFDQKILLNNKYINYKKYQIITKQGVVFSLIKCTVCLFILKLVLLAQLFGLFQFYFNS